jgi:hypothetical protein
MEGRTEACSKIYEFVKEWMQKHPEMQGVWNVFDVQLGLDIIISIHQLDGVRRLTLPHQQTAHTLTPDVESKVINWLETLPDQPTVQD